MKIQCVLCKEIVELGAFEPTGDGVRIPCSACRENFFLEKSGRVRRDEVASARPAPGPTPTPASAPVSAPASAPVSAPVASDGPDCPKCGLGVTNDAAACASCGLLREHFDSFARDAKRDEDPKLEALWQAAEADWDDDAAHESFTARAAATGAYATAARHYRLALRARPSDTVAADRLERVTKMAEVSLLSKRPEEADEPAGPYRSVVILLVLLLALGGVAGIYALTKGTKSDGANKSKPVPAAPSKPR